MLITRKKYIENALKRRRLVRKLVEIIPRYEGTFKRHGKLYTVPMPNEFTNYISASEWRELFVKLGYFNMLNREKTSGWTGQVADVNWDELIPVIQEVIESSPLWDDIKKCQERPSFPSPLTRFHWV